MESLKKILTRVQLINWHFFENEQISLHGSTLISGENTAGKSTILDAIQLVLTTNTRKFNVAANEKGNRSLKGYVRCKIGRVMRCEDVKDLENYLIAITPDCMLYQGYVVRHLNPRDYENPFIGRNAYRIQIVNVKKEIEAKSVQRNGLREQLKLYNNNFESAGKVKTELLRLYMNAPLKHTELQEKLIEAQKELKEASDDPTYTIYRCTGTKGIKESKSGIL